MRSMQQQQRYWYCLLVTLTLVSAPSRAFTTLELKCQVCTRLVEHVRGNISAVSPARLVQVANFRLDGAGDRPKKMVPMASSQVYLSELLDTVCTKIDDYVRATHKSNGTLIVMPLLLNGAMNPLMSEVDVVADSDLNKSLKYYCDDIVDDIADDIIAFQQSGGNPDRMVYAMCTQAAQLCPADNDHNRPEL
ncbi:protein seele-like [Adelges cooleyi]|uniref:protein seele-like n=1 Tax=Adelges cooleyi TaxID=133065 RepID=UPI0021805466|nr:protein seele-like [Adelges cooleyi]